MPTTRQELVAQVDSKLLSAVQRLAVKEGRQLQVLVEEALADLIEKHKNGPPRSRVMSAYVGSHEKFASVYKKLAQ